MMTDRSADQGRLRMTPPAYMARHNWPPLRDRTSTVSGVRPYLLTAGRAQPVDQSLEIEAQIRTSQLGTSAQARLAFERRDIVDLCQAMTLSVAEVAARMDLHINVTRVLVADLAALGYLLVHRPQSAMTRNVDLIERVIRGLEAIR